MVVVIEDEVHFNRPNLGKSAKAVQDLTEDLKVVPVPADVLTVNQSPGQIVKKSLITEPRRETGPENLTKSVKAITAPIGLRNPGTIVHHAVVQDLEEGRKVNQDLMRLDVKVVQVIEEDRKVVPDLT